MFKDVKAGDVVSVLPNPYNIPQGWAVCTQSLYSARIAIIETLDGIKNIHWSYLKVLSRSGDDKLFANQKYNDECRHNGIYT